jgi:CBS domain-containing protein
LRAVGVLTDRDIVVTVVARQIDPAAVRVGEIMTPDPVTIAENASVAQALQELRRMTACQAST